MNTKIRSYVIGGLRVKVNVGTQKKMTMPAFLASKTMNARILRGSTVTGKRVLWNNLARVALVKVLAKRDGFCCNNPNCPSRKNTADYVKYFGLDWLQIDHIDNNPNNNNIDNYQLLCSSCNSSKGYQKIRIA